MNPKFWQFLGFTANSYLMPIKPREGEKPRFWRGSPAHKGNYSHARDIITPDPNITKLPVYAPASGRIHALNQADLYGGIIPNFIMIATEHGEYCELVHIAKSSCPFSVGDHVQIGQIIAETGVNGFMLNNEHLHIMVCIRAKNKDGFVSLRIRWQKNPVYP